MDSVSTIRQNLLGSYLSLIAYFLVNTGIIIGLTYLLHLRSNESIYFVNPRVYYYGVRVVIFLLFISLVVPTGLFVYNYLKRRNNASAENDSIDGINAEKVWVLSDVQNSIAESRSLGVRYSIDESILSSNYNNSDKYLDTLNESNSAQLIY